MIIWLNGPFGVGKTTTARILVDALPGSAIFDTEEIGYMLRPTLAARRPVEDFQDWAPWRSLSIAAIDELARYLDADIIVPQTVVVREYWGELLDGLRGAGQDVAAVTLDVGPEEHERRITTDEVETQAVEWRRMRAVDFAAARPWLATTSTVIDTTTLAPGDVVEQILGVIGAR
jgi:cytidylate kinase